MLAWFILPAFLPFLHRRIMSARDKAQGTPRRSSSLSSTSEGKRRDRDLMDSEAKRRKAASTEESTSQPLLLTACASQPSALASEAVAGPSGVNMPAAPPDAELGRLSSLLSGLIEKLDKSAAPQVSPGTSAGFSGFHNLSSSGDEDGEILEDPSQQSVSDPLDDQTRLPLVSHPLSQWPMSLFRRLSRSLLATSTGRRSWVTLCLSA